MNFQGRTAIVTGGNGYIGGTISRKLLEQGASVAIFDIALENARKTAEEFENAYPVSVDLTNPDSVQAAVAGTIKHFGKADLLVTSAGGSARSRMKPFAEQDMNVIRGIIEMNLFGALHVIHAVVPHMFRQNCQSLLSGGSRRRGRMCGLRRGKGWNHRRNQNTCNGVWTA